MFTSACEMPSRKMKISILRSNAQHNVTGREKKSLSQMETLPFSNLINYFYAKEKKSIKVYILKGKRGNGRDLAQSYDKKAIPTGKKP